MKFVLAGLTALLLVHAPRVAAACSVCGAAEDETKNTFIFTTAFLTFLPLTIVGGVVFWIYRRAKQLDNEIDPEC